ncbi:translation initiation factor IF-2 [Marinicrinis lubricantis]|uniref:Translation initiation factor IF-2 n=1 Tax=Marinicrinis lubricantis TaxID=2086470 RepID=A0ABW1IMA3_9BACL
MSSKEIITIMKRLDIPVNNHMSVMESDAIAKVEKFFKDIKENAAAKQQKKEQKGEAIATVQNVTNQNTSQNQSSADKSVSSERQQDRKPQQASRTQNRNSNGEQRRDARTQGTSQQGRPTGQGGQGDRSKEFGQRRNHPQGANQGQGQRAQGQGNAGQNARRDSSRPSVPSKPANAALRSEEEFNASKGKTTKKDKANPKRFDDNKVSTIKGGGRGGKNFKGKRNQQHRGQERREKVDNTPKKVIVRGTMTVGEVAKLFHKDASELIKKLLMMGVMATINQELDLDTIQLISAEFGIEVELKLPVEEDPFEMDEVVEDPENLMERPPVVTIMGHVDHGKTTLLDAIRHTNVTAGEAGGITQHIGAYQVESNGKKITFLDTPGHEAFTTMRARGSKVTDITILVVAADDGVMPQTVEAINHAKAANVPIIVAVNKIDKPEANPDKIRQELTEYALIPEEWGGETIFVNVSAKSRTNLDELLEMILLVAEVQELKANPNTTAKGTVIEAELDKGKGPVARILVQDGTLRIGDPFVAGVFFGRVRAMVNDKGRRLKEAGPSTPVEITGLHEVPQAGDRLIAFDDERKAREIADKRTITLRESELNSSSRVTLDDLYKHIQEGEMKELFVIIKADVQGSAEALKGSLEKIDIEGVRVKIIHTGVGAITESDIILASASNAIIIGFNVRPEPAAKITADQEKVDIRLHRIIYNVIEEIEQAMKGMLDPVYKEQVTGQAEIRNIFKISKIGTVAGCMVISGKITRNAQLRVIRNGIVVYEGELDALKRFKDDVKEVAQGYECGISVKNFNDLKEGDILEAFVMEAVER